MKIPLIFIRQMIIKSSVLAPRSPFTALVARWSPGGGQRHVHDGWMNGWAWGKGFVTETNCGMDVVNFNFVWEAMLLLLLLLL